MKTFLTLQQAYEATELLEMKETDKDLIKALESIRVCLVGEMNGYSLWGQNIEDACPLFREGLSPSENATAVELENYRAYQEEYLRAVNLFRKGAIHG